MLSAPTRTTPAASMRSISWAASPSVFTVMALSGCVDTGRLGFVRQREFIDQPRQPQRHFEVRPHGRPPGFLDRQRKRLGYGVDVIVQGFGSHFSLTQLLDEPATAGAGSPSAIPLYRRPADRRAPARMNLAPR